VLLVLAAALMQCACGSEKRERSWNVQRSRNRKRGGGGGVAMKIEARKADRRALDVARSLKCSQLDKPKLGFRASTVMGLGVHRLHPLPYAPLPFTVCTLHRPGRQPRGMRSRETGTGLGIQTKDLYLTISY
jgi:hypothetical protein